MNGNSRSRDSGWSRRRFLGTAGTLVALPFLESLLPRGARAGTAAGPKRLITYSVPNGVYMNQWTPTSSGSQYALTPLLQPFAAIRDHILVLTNTRNRAAEGLANAPANAALNEDHARGTGSMYTCASINYSSGPSTGVSVDQVAAASIGKPTVFPYQALGMQLGPDASAADNNVSPTYNHALSYTSAGTPILPTTQPMTVFNNFFASTDANQSAAEAALRQQYGKSVLDSALAQMNALNNQLGSSDRTILAQYATNVRQLETQLQVSNQCNVGQPPANVDPTNANNTQAISNQMHALMALALQCDLTRVISFMAAPTEADRPYGFLGVSGGHHELTHDDSARAQVGTINLWEMQQLAAFLTTLQGYQEGSNTVLDNIALVLTCEIRGVDDNVSGGDHSHYSMPMLIAGKCGGALATGQSLIFPADISSQPDFSSVYLALLQAVGVGATSFAGQTTPLTQILA